MYLVGYIVFMTFLLSQVEEYNMQTEISNTNLEQIENISVFDSIINYIQIFLGIITFNILSGTEDIPIWFNLLIAVPFYALIIYFIMDIIFPQVSD